MMIDEMRMMLLCWIFNFFFPLGVIALYNYKINIFSMEFFSPGTQVLMGYIPRGHATWSVMKYKNNCSIKILYID